MRTRIKFCGMTRVEDVVLANDLGVDAIGLIFADASKRRLDAGRARELRAAAGPLMHVVALFMDNAITQVQGIISIVRPTLLQFHGAESAEECERFGLPYLKAVAMDADDPLAVVRAHPKAAGFVLDSHATGGSGERFDWTRVPRTIGRPVLLAGGLQPGNVAEAVRVARPQAVDVASGIEAAPGVKDDEKMRRFVAEVRRADGNE